MDKLLAILEELRPDIDFTSHDDLIDSHLLDSLTILSLVAELEDAFDITIPAVEIVPKNFNSVAAMQAMIGRLEEEG